MLRKPFEQTIRQLCEDVLSEPTPEALPEKIIDHVQMTFQVQSSTLWLTEQKGTSSEKRLRLAAAGGVAKKLMTAEHGEPAVYDFGQGITGEIAQRAETCNITNYEEFKKHLHAKKYDNVMYGGSRAEEQCRCVLGVPLLLKSTNEANSSENQPWRVIGVLKLENIEKSAEHPAEFFTTQDVEIVEAYAAVIAVALEKAQMRADSLRIAAGLLDVSRSLLAELGEPPRIEQIVQQTANVISAEACSLWLRSGFQLRLAAAYGYQVWDEVLPYQLEQHVDRNNEAKAGTDTEDSGAQAQYRGVGLTVYVATTGKSLNLTTADEIRNHFAWRGVNDELMWAKPRGTACYSLLAIPLIDNDTQDLRGVFKIENKKPTLFQLQSFFTREDEQLLTILGNSISSSLSITERLERLRRLARLIGDVRILSNLDEALFFILTGLTHRDGLQYGRAMIFLVDEARTDRLVCQFAIGQIDPADWQREMDTERDRPFLDLDKLLREFRADKEKHLHSPMTDKWKGYEVNTADTDRSVIARYAATVKSGPNQELHTTKYNSGELSSGDMLSGFASGDFVLIPITVEKSLRGIIYADNRFTGNRVNRFECDMLDLFAGMAGAIIHASGVPQKLQQERDEAWQAFSRPAAHRLGTEAGIIDTEAELYIKRELEQGILTPDGRIAVRPDVIVNSLQTIQQAVNRLRLAVRDYQRLAFQAEEAHVDLDLCELVDQIIHNTTLKGIEVNRRFGDQPLRIHAAQRGITYVFEELLINAWKQAQSESGIYGGVLTIGMRVLIELRREHDRAVCMFCDSGPGIPASVIPTLFQKPTVGRKGGTGLGLYIIGQILKENKASIDIITSDKPEGFDGACFKITFPLCTSQESAQSDTGERPAPSVLVVEDNPVARRHLFKILTENGFSCESASNENEAESRVSKTLRTIIADINLSEAGGRLNGGILLAEDLAGMGRRIPIILISNDPWYYLPPKNSLEFGEMQKRLSIVSVIDRNSNTFYEELVRTLIHSTRV